MFGRQEQFLGEGVILRQKLIFFYHKSDTKYFLIIKQFFWKISIFQEILQKTVLVESIWGSPGELTFAHPAC